MDADGRKHTEPNGEFEFLEIFRTRVLTHLGTMEAHGRRIPDEHRVRIG
jgi:hypothetical protein